MSPGFVGLMEFKLAGLVSRWAHLIPPGSESAPLMECALRWVSMNSGELAFSGLPEPSFMTIMSKVQLN